MKRHILFVDDEPRVHEAFKRTLRSQRDHWDMHFVSSVAEAVQITEQVALDVIVSDVTMPECDGFELLRIMRQSQRTRDIPVVIVTGSDQDDLKKRALEMGAADLLCKPVDRDELLARLHSALRLKSYEDELRTHNDILTQKVAEKTAELASSRLDIILRLGKAAEFRDEETGNHIIRVGCYCHAIATEMGMDKGFVESVLLASPLHDIGKIGVPDSILLKEGKFTDSEREIMKTHCAIGAEILQHEPKSLKPFLQRCPGTHPTTKDGNPVIDMACAIILCHHERWDGSGYPQGLNGSDIPPAARIAALADVYDALRSDRPYKNAYSEQETLELIRSGQGGSFDPLVLQAFESAIAAFDAVYAEFVDNLAKAATTVTT